jgi:alpha-beta hydrolase superfamily lysophospholipase
MTWRTDIFSAFIDTRSKHHTALPVHAFASSLRNGFGDPVVVIGHSVG